MGRPGAGTGPEGAVERLLPPGAARGRRDGRKGRHRAELLWMAQRQHQRAMPAHGMAEDAGAPGIAGQLAGGDAVQLVGHVAFHAVMGAPRLGGGVQVEAGAGAEIPVLVFRSEEPTSELQSLMRISYAVFCLKQKKK